MQYDTVRDTDVCWSEQLEYPILDYNYIDYVLILHLFMLVQMCMKKKHAIYRCE